MQAQRRLGILLPHLNSRYSSISSYRKNSTVSNTETNQNDNNNDEVLLENIGNKCLITLNRPKVLNALNLSMIRKITPVLKQWEQDKKLLVIIKGVGGKAFCAGGDIRSIVEAKKTGSDLLSRQFFYEEYQLNYMISTLQTPYLALIDGITMGGGVGLSVHGYYRVSTERTVFAMPETAIGFFPDVGGTYFLPRLKGKLGLFLALTGYRLKGADVYHAGISTHALGSQNLEIVEEELLSLKPNPESLDLERCLGKYTSEAPFIQKPFTLQPYLQLIDECFSSPTVEEILINLERCQDPFAKEILVALQKMSPLSLKITKRALDEGSEMTLAECLEMEYRLSQRFFNDHDFSEGVRALLIDKDQNPQWKPKTLQECTKEHVESYFKPFEDANRELKL